MSDEKDPPGRRRTQPHLSGKERFARAIARMEFGKFYVSDHEAKFQDITPGEARRRRNKTPRNGQRGRRDA
ncbi:MAG: hypothetical protein D6773_14780 [Alphaproteobacteria bacterium]|nr:MAG: hypothetical protein D6773_14780 [Alphaproteobacteria bacterium]